MELNVVAYTTFWMASILPLLHSNPQFHPTSIIVVLVIRLFRTLNGWSRRVESLSCEVCEFSKHRRVSFPLREERRVSSPFHLVHSDVWGPMRVPSRSHFQYFVVFVDDYSRATYIYLMQKRSELYSIFKSFYEEIKTQFDVDIRIFRSDNAREYFRNALSQFLDEHGILHQSSCARTPQQNGVAERKLGHILTVTRALLFQMNVPKSYWSDAVLAAG